MSFLNRLMGRGKKAAGDLANDPQLRKEGAHQEQQGMAEDRAQMHQEQADAARTDAAKHEAERETS